ncbi:MAG: hypothetical protein AAF280_07195 [Pseudomonadota bacterium]
MMGVIKLLRKLCAAGSMAAFIFASAPGMARADATRDLAAWLGLPMIGDYAVMYDGKWVLNKETKERTDQVSQKWRKLSSVVRFFAEPANFEDVEQLYSMAWRTLDPVDLKAIRDQIGSDDLFAQWYGEGALLELSEFKRRALGELLRTRYLDKMKARLPTGPINIVEIRHIGIGEYDFDAQNFPFTQSGSSKALKRDVPAFSFLSLGTSRNDTPVRVDSVPPVIPPALAVPLQQAEAFAAAFNTNYATQRSVYVAHLGVLQGYLKEDDALVAVVESVAAGLYMDRDLQQVITGFDVQSRADKEAEAQAALAAEQEAERAAEEAAKQAEVAAQTEEQERLKSRVEVAQRQIDQLDLAVLGIKLGMTGDEARAALVKSQSAFEGNTFSTDRPFGTSRGGSSLSPCQAARSQARREFSGLSSDLEPDQIEAAYKEIVAAMSPECRPEADPLGASFGGEAVFQDGRIRDAIHVYLGREDHVVAVVRTIFTSGVDLDLKAGAIERFGAPLLDAEIGRIFWPMSAEALVRAELDNGFRNRCYPGGVVMGSFSSAVDSGGDVQVPTLQPSVFREACGQMMGASFDRNISSFFLVDTDHIVGIRVQAQEVKETETQSLESAIEF